MYGIQNEVETDTGDILTISTAYLSFLWEC